MANRLDVALIDRAVEGLLAYELKNAAEREEKSLLGAGYSKPFFATVQLKKMISKPVVKPVRVKIPYSLFSPEANDDTVCLFCRSEDKEAIIEFLAKNPVEGLTKIVSLNDLKKQYKEFENRKKLYKEHTHFLCDMRIVAHLYNLLGKSFLSKHSNSPIPIDYNHVHGIPAAVMQCVSSSYMHLKGSVISIKLGTTLLTKKHIAMNIVQGLDFAVSKLHGGWKDVLSIHLKTSDSPALPVYTKIQSDSHTFMKNEAQKSMKRSRDEDAEDDDVPAKLSKKANKTTAAAPTPSPTSAQPTAPKKSASVKGADTRKKAAAPAAPAAPSTAVKLAQKTGAAEVVEKLRSPKTRAEKAAITKKKM